jgi:glycerate dehydrogenase
MKFKKLVVLDKILLTEQHWKHLRNLAAEVVEFGGLSPDEVLEKLHGEMEDEAKPMCWTQLAVDKVSAEELALRVHDADAIITCWTGIPDDLLLRCENLKYIGFWTNLVGHRVNVDLARQRGIHVTRIPDYGTDSVAELTFSGMLAVSRQLLRSHRNTLRGQWPYELLKSGQFVPKVDEIPTSLLLGKTLGIVGMGRIGKRVAQLARAFGMKIQYNSKHRHGKQDEHGAKFVNLSELFATSDVVSIHLSPYAPPRLINGDLIRSMKDGAIFINTSAGTLVDQEALFGELQTGRIHAFLDVYEGLPPRKVIKNVSTLDNVFTYRSGWYTREAITYKGDYLLENIQRFLAGDRSAAVWDEPEEEEDITEVPCPKERAGT